MMDNNEHSFLNPLWRRVVLVAICAIWTAIEFWTNSPGWGMIALAFTGYAIWRFLYIYDPSKADGRSPDSNPGKDG